MSQKWCNRGLKAKEFRANVRTGVRASCSKVQSVYSHLGCRNRKARRYAGPSLAFYYLYSTKPEETKMPTIFNFINFRMKQMAVAWLDN